jgi:hypothetical protein
MANGARLGWLLDPIENRATVSRSNQPAEKIANPTIMSGEPVLSGFTFDFGKSSELFGHGCCARQTYQLAPLRTYRRSAMANCCPAWDVI